MNQYLLIVLAIVFVFIMLVVFVTKNKLFDVSINDTKYVDMNDYGIEEIPGFLTPEECQKIIELSNGKLFASKVYSQNEDVLSSDTRQSQQCWLTDENPIIKNISDRVREYTKTPTNNQEQLQVVNYSKGGFFSPHYDACEGNADFCKRMDGEQGPRLLTVLFYLNDEFEGGETIFPKINKVVKPQKGKAVIFRNVNKDGIIIRQALHGGEPIKNGEKWIANKWIRIN